jgi:hemoglobin
MPSIYDSIGGRDAVAAAVDGLYARLLADDELAPFFAHTEMRRQKAHMRAFLGIALGGPEIYRGRDMTAAHAHLTITDDTFDRVVDHVVATLPRSAYRARRSPRSAPRWRRCASRSSRPQSRPERSARGGGAHAPAQRHFADQ